MYLGYHSLTRSVVVVGREWHISKYSFIDRCKSVYKKCIRPLPHLYTSPVGIEFVLSQQLLAYKPAVSVLKVRHECMRVYEYKFYYWKYDYDDDEYFISTLNFQNCIGTALWHASHTLLLFALRTDTFLSEFLLPSAVSIAHSFNLLASPICIILFLLRL